MVENSCEETMMRLHGQFQPVDPRIWNTDMDMSVNVGVGTGQEGERHAALAQALQMQMQIWSQYGNGNGLVTMTGIRNTLGDMLALQGVRNIDRYFNPMTPEMEQQLIAQQQQQAQENPQMTDGDYYKIRGSHNKSPEGIVYNGGKSLSVGYSKDYDPSKRYPLTIQKFSNHNQKKDRLHPTQKPLELLEYLVKTYTNENETVLDNTMGSGTTMVACRNLNRHGIGIEKDPQYYAVAVARVDG